MSVRGPRSTTETQPDQLSVAGWIWLGAITLWLTPVAGMVASLVVLDLSGSLPGHVATAAMLPAAVVAAVAPRLGASGGVVLRLALIASTVALILLNLAWSGVPG
jgi:hypothetical protein